jgi:hypothetical protein
MGDAQRSARWRDLPAHFPSPPTCWRRFKAWTEAGVSYLPRSPFEVSLEDEPRRPFFNGLPGKTLLAGSGMVDLAVRTRKEPTSLLT